MKPYTLTLMALAVGCSAAAQINGMSCGLRVGASRSSIANMARTLVDDEERAASNITEHNYVSPTATAYAQYRFPVSRVAAEGSLTYVQSHTSLDKTYLSDSETYDVKTHHVVLGFGMRVFVWHGAYAKAGMAVGPCLNPTTAITYTAKGMSPSMVMQQNGHIRESAKVGTLANAELAIGYEFESGLAIEASYSRALTDLVEVGVNNFGVKEIRNDAQHISLTVGWVLSNNGKTSR